MLGGTGAKRGPVRAPRGPMACAATPPPLPRPPHLPPRPLCNQSLVLPRCSWAPPFNLQALTFALFPRAQEPPGEEPVASEAEMPQEAGTAAEGEPAAAERENPPAAAEGGTEGSEEEALAEDTRIIFVLGGPGSGKGTQCERLVEKYGVKHLSAGDLLRAEVASGSEVGQQCQEIMKEGQLVPTEVTLGLIKKAMASSSQKTFIIDGFPRAVDQGEAFEASIKPCDFVLFLDCPKETMQERLLKRGETSGRADDNLETIGKRFDTFMEVSMPVMDHFADKVHKLSSVPNPDEVFAEV